MIRLGLTNGVKNLGLKGWEYCQYKDEVGSGRCEEEMVATQKVDEDTSTQELEEESPADFLSSCREGFISHFPNEVFPERDFIQLYLEVGSARLVAFRGFRRVKVGMDDVQLTGFSPEKIIPLLVRDLLAAIDVDLGFEVDARQLHARLSKQLETQYEEVIRDRAIQTLHNSIVEATILGRSIPLLSQCVDSTVRCVQAAFPHLGVWKKIEGRVRAQLLLQCAQQKSLHLALEWVRDQDLGKMGKDVDVGEYLYKLLIGECPLLFRGSPEFQAEIRKRVLSQVAFSHQISLVNESTERLRILREEAHSREKIELAFRTHGVKRPLQGQT